MLIGLVSPITLDLTVSPLSWFCICLRARPSRSQNNAPIAEYNKLLYMAVKVNKQALFLTSSVYRALGAPPA